MLNTAKTLTRLKKKSPCFHFHQHFISSLAPPWTAVHLHFPVFCCFYQASALLHEKGNRKEEMPQIEKVTQKIMGAAQGGRSYGVANERKTGGNAGIRQAIPKGGREREIETAQ
jgi:hypothetical protein